MTDSGAELPPLARLGVIVLCVLLAASFLAFEGEPPLPPRTWSGVVVTSAIWSERWTNLISPSPFRLPGLSGPCVTNYDQNFTPSGFTNFSGPNFNCFFIIGGVSQMANGTGQIGTINLAAVEVNSPFQLVAYLHYVIFPCENCAIVGVEIRLPTAPGNYVLTGTLEFYWQD